ncbi:MAG: tetratricopeptide repeat protein, partial [Candidatus Marinimicrobia bacterium]|nr:tetratricopeptide repeat protein [Candidatus Neomarinimicrobiota bacterium]
IGVYFLLEKSDLAREMFDRAIAIKPDAVMYSNMATVEFYEGLYANAVTLYEEAIKLGEENSTIFGNLADSYRYATGDSEKAQQAYRDAIRLGEKELAIYPGDVRLRSRLAGYYVEVSDYKNAIAEITNAKSMAPNNSYVLQKCVLVFELAEQRENALQALSEYIKLDGSMEEIEKDPDLSGLRVDPRYRQLVNR